jgi:hypothetical protein
MKAASATAARMAEAFQRNKIHPFPEMTAGTYTSQCRNREGFSVPLLGTSGIDQKDNSAGRERPHAELASPVRVMYRCAGSSMV